jgi:hypothetical protein
LDFLNLQPILWCYIILYYIYINCFKNY